MEPISIKNGLYERGGKPFFPVSGEFHYFRVPRADWKKRMALFREAGGNLIATYLPWLIHEPAEGDFRFNLGDGITDVRRFLECAAEFDLGVIVRPGPYQYSELIHHGLPGWLLAKYPEILARSRKGKILNEASVSYLHPVFLAAVKRYYDQLCPMLAEYTVSRGGPVCFAQPDNEIFGIHVWNGDYDFNPGSAGFGREDGRYARFLQGRYGTVEAANAAYGTAKRSFGEFMPADEPADGTAKWLWNRDWFDCYTDMGAEYLETLSNWMRDAGLDVPLVHNSANPGMNPMFRETKKRLGDRITVGSDHYYNLTQEWDQNNPTPQYLIYCYLSLEMLRLMGDPPTVFEFPFGTCSDWPPLTPEDFDAGLKSHVAIGMRGLNGYIYTGGPNVPGTGTTSSLYDYGAPVGPAGEIRPTYEVLKQFGNGLGADPDSATGALAADFRIVMPWHAARAEKSWGAPQPENVVNPADLWRFVRRGLVSSAFAGGMAGEFAEWESLDLSLPAILPCDGSLAADDQRKAVAFLERGGRLLVIPALPSHDENYRPCTILADYLGAAAGRRILAGEEMLRFEIAGVPNVFCNHSFVVNTKIPAGAEIIGTEERYGAAAWRKELPSGGVAMVCSMSWVLTNREHFLALGGLLDRLGMKRHVRNSDLWCFAILRGDKLFVCNLSTAAREPEIAVRLDGEDEFRAPFAVKLPPMSVEVLPLR